MRSHHSIQRHFLALFDPPEAALVNLCRNFRVVPALMVRGYVDARGASVPRGEVGVRLGGADTAQGPVDEV